MIKTYSQIDFISFLNQFEKNEYLERRIPISYFESTSKDIQKSFKYINSYVLNESRLNFIPIFVSLSYNKKEIIIKEVNKNMCYGYFQLDYMEREKYVSFVYEVNASISRNGCVIHYVSNIPDHLNSVLYFECSRSEYDIIKKISEKNHVKISTSKKLTDFIYEQRYRQWNAFQYLPHMTIQEVERFYLNCFEFKSNKELKNLGYDFSKKIYKPKIFVSYSWENKDIVRKFVQCLEEEGLNIWIDYKSIDYGENIFESILNGIDDCDIVLAFISEDYKKSLMAKKELISFFKNVVEGKKRWKIIKLDSVNPNDIYYTLGDYKYFDMVNENIDGLILSIKEEVKRIQNEHQN